MPRTRSEVDRRSAPRIVARPGTRKRVRHRAPPVACVAAGTASPDIQQPLAHCIEAKESQHHSLLGCSHAVITADQLVVRHAAVGQDDGSPRLDSYVRTEWEARPKHQRVEPIALKSYIRP